MRLSRNAEGLIADLAKEQGLQKLEFDADGLIPIRLAGETQIAIGYSPNNDALMLCGVIDPAPDRATLDCWDILKRNATLAERRTRLALEPATGALMLSCDVYVEAMDFMRFSEIMDRFVDDLGEAAKAARSRSQTFRPTASELQGVSDHVVIWA